MRSQALLYNDLRERREAVRHLDLFSGIGGFALAAMTVWGKDYECVGFCDIEPYAQQLLKIRFPGVPIYEDIKKLTAAAGCD